MGESKGLWKCPKTMEAKLIELLNPVEPLIMRLQSLLVWEYPYKSAIFLVFIHFVFWFVAVCCVQIYCLVSVTLMVIFFVDTWKKKIWPEIRVPPPFPEDTDGWTPVHPRLLSVPEISRYLSTIIFYCIHILVGLRHLHRDKPFHFFLVSAAILIFLAILGSYLSGFMIIYIFVLFIVIWPGAKYHSVQKKIYLYMEPAFQWFDNQLRTKLPFRRGSNQTTNQQLSSMQASLTTNQNLHDGRSGGLAQVVEEVEEEDLMPAMDSMSTEALALAVTESDDDEDTGGISPFPTPGLSKEPSLDNSDDDRHTDDFSLDIDGLPSFDDLDHSDDDITSFAVTDRQFQSQPESSDMSFLPSHFDDSDSDDEDAMAKELSFHDVAQTVLSTDTDASAAILTSTLVTKTLSSMMETALQGMMGLTGAQGSSSGLLPRTGTKITYTKTLDGESIDFATPEPTIAEDDESCEPSDDEHTTSMGEQLNEVAEIEKDFDFLDELEDGEEKTSAKR